MGTEERGMFVSELENVLFREKTRRCKKLEMEASSKRLEKEAGWDALEKSFQSWSPRHSG